MSSSGKKISDHPVIIVLGVISACIAIFAFCTGIQSITQIFSKLNQGFGKAPSSNSFTPIPSTEPTSVEIVEGDWTQVGLPGDTISDLEIVNENLIYASTFGFEHGIFKTDDGGNKWYAINNGLGNLDIYAITLMNEDKNTLIAGSGLGVWATQNGGQTWQPTPPAGAESDYYGIARLRIYSVATTSSSIYIVPSGGRLMWGNVYVSQNFGSTWESLEKFSTQAGNDTIFFNGSTKLVTTSRSPSPTIYIAGDEDLFRSGDDGVTWYPIAHVGSNFNIADIVADLSNSSNVYVCTGNRIYGNQSISFDSGNGVYISSDSGGSWLPINNGLPNQGNNTECTKLALDTMNSQRVYVAVNGQVFASENKGEDWTQIGVLPDELGAITAMAVYGQKICIGVDQNGIWCTLR